MAEVPPGDLLGGGVAQPLHPVGLPHLLVDLALVGAVEGGEKLPPGVDEGGIDDLDGADHRAPLGGPLAQVDPLELDQGVAGGRPQRHRDHQVEAVVVVVPGPRQAELAALVGHRGEARDVLAHPAQAAEVERRARGLEGDLQVRDRLALAVGHHPGEQHLLALGVRRAGGGGGERQRGEQAEQRERPAGGGGGHRGGGLLQAGKDRDHRVAASPAARRLYAAAGGPPASGGPAPSSRAASKGMTEGP